MDFGVFAGAGEGDGGGFGEEVAGRIDAGCPEFLGGDFGGFDDEDGPGEQGGDVEGGVVAPGEEGGFGEGTVVFGLFGSEVYLFVIDGGFEEVDLPGTVTKEAGRIEGDSEGLGVDGVVDEVDDDGGVGLVRFSADDGVDGEAGAVVDGKRGTDAIAGFGEAIADEGGGLVAFEIVGVGTDEAEEVGVGFVGAEEALFVGGGAAIHEDVPGDEHEVARGVGEGDGGAGEKGVDLGVVIVGVVAFGDGEDLDFVEVFGALEDGGEAGWCGGHDAEFGHTEVELLFDGSPGAIEVIAGEDDVLGGVGAEVGEEIVVEIF